MHKQTMQNTAKQDYPGSAASYNTQPGKNMGLFYNAPKSTWYRPMHAAEHPELRTVHVQTNLSDPKGGHFSGTFSTWCALHFPNTAYWEASLSCNDLHRSQRKENRRHSFM